jgi:hypothetical protein
MWLAAGAEPLWIQYEFDRVYQLHQMLVWNYNVQFELMLGFGVKNATVEYSRTAWNGRPGRGGAGPGDGQDHVHLQHHVDFGGGAARYVRLTVNSGYGMMGQFGLSEVRFTFVPGHARQPVPADGATDVIRASLSAGERGGRPLRTRSTSGPIRSSFAGRDVAEAASRRTIGYANTYYWRVDEVNEAEAVSRWEGDVWSFATAAYGIVDDMEDYTDDLDAALRSSTLD